MDIVFRHQRDRISSGEPALLYADVDGRPLEARIDWETLQGLGASGRDEAVRGFLERYRREIERAVRTQLFAQGVPVSRLIVLDAGDLRAAGVGAPESR
ncbi:MAG TPA: hypothetical protein VEG27_07905 [Usitatibacter sp.]|nr:hypothetical protein [Usitatibacter sp.]